MDPENDWNFKLTLNSFSRSMLRFISHCVGEMEVVDLNFLNLHLKIDGLDPRPLQYRINPQ